MVNPPIEEPAGYVPVFAMSFADVSGGSITAGHDNPLPVVVVSGSAIPSLADQSVVDAQGVFWLVRDNGGSLTYLNWANGAAGTPVAPVVPAGQAATEQVRGTQFNAVTAGAGYAAHDVLEHIVVLDLTTTPATVTTSVWLNITQGTVLSATPGTASLSEIASSTAVSNFPAIQTVAGSVNIANLPATQAVSGTVNVVPGSGISSFATSAAAGAIADIGTGATPGANTLNGRLAQINATLGTPLQAGGAVSVSNFPALQPVSGTVSVANLPTIQGISATDGTLITVGATSDSAYGGVGAASVVSLLKGIYAAAAAPTPAGSNLIGLTQPNYSPMAAWGAPSVAFDARAYACVTVAVTSAPSAAWTPQWSPDNVNWFAIIGMDLGFNQMATIAAGYTGALSLKGAGFIRLTGGTSGSFLVGAGQ